MNFAIQVSSPKISGKFDAEDETLDECIETSFVLRTEMAIIKWNDYYIPLTYKYTISSMAIDILDMLQELLDKRHGNQVIEWPSSEFRCRWEIQWKEDELVIHSKWESVIGQMQDFLNTNHKLELKKTSFIAEWKKLLEVVYKGVVDCGYNESKIIDISRLKSICSQISASGKLYQ